MKSPAQSPTVTTSRLKRVSGFGIQLLIAVLHESVRVEGTAQLLIRDLFLSIKVSLAFGLARSLLRGETWPTGLCRPDTDHQLATVCRGSHGLV